METHIQYAGDREEFDMAESDVKEKEVNIRQIIGLWLSAGM